MLDWLASDFVAHKYDVKHLIATIMTSRAYQMPAVARTAEAPARNYAFRGPELRRLTAEQFADAIGTITGEWSVFDAPPPGSGEARDDRQARRRRRRRRRVRRARARDSDSRNAGYYVREYRNSSSHLTRALGRPIRDQVTSVRATEATTLQSLELVNGEILTGWLMRGARRMTGQLPDDPLSLFNASVGGRNIQPRMFDADVSGASKLWLIISDTGSNAPERVLPAFVKAEFVGPDGAVPLSSLTPVDGSGLRLPRGPDADRVPVKNSSRLVYDISGRGFTQLPRQRRRRQRARRSRLDAESAAAVLHLRRRAEHEPAAAARPGMPLPGSGPGQHATRASSTTSSGPRSAARRRLPSASWRKRRSPIQPARDRSRRCGRRFPLGHPDEARVPADLLTNHATPNSAIELQSRSTSDA